MRYANSGFKIEVDTTPSSTATYVEIGVENLDWQINDEVQTGFMIKDGGAGYSDVTGGRLTVVVTGKRDTSDVAQNYLMGLMGQWGAARKTTLKLTGPDGGYVEIPSSVQLGNKGGDAIALDAFSATFHSDGAWTSSGASI